MRNKMTDKETIDKQAKRIAELEATQNNVASPCGFLDIWSDSSASERREYTLEELLSWVKLAQANDGIIGIRSQYMKASNQTPGTIASYQVFPSHVLTYEEDNKQKEELDKPTSYKTKQFSKNVDGVNCWLNERKQKVAVNQ